MRLEECLSLILMTCTLTTVAASGNETDEVKNKMIIGLLKSYKQVASLHQSKPPVKREISEAETSISNEDDIDGLREKRFLTLFRQRATKSEGYKRGPGFRSWGGKRSGEEDKRVGFSSWGGKREDAEMHEDKGEGEFSMPFEQFQKRLSIPKYGKRKPFQSWGGKREYLSTRSNGPLYLRQADLRKLLSWEGKRRFSSWGGKRGDDFEKRGKQSFRSWGGKRSDAETDDESTLSTETSNEEREY